MKTPPALSQELWERTPSEVRAYIEVLETRVATLEAMVQALREQLTRHRGILPVLLRVTRSNTNVHLVLGVSAVAAGNRGTLAIRAP